MAEYARSTSNNDYAENRSYASSSSVSYSDSSARASEKSSLHVIDSQVKEKPRGICTCNKVAACRGTCRV